VFVTLMTREIALTFGRGATYGLPLVFFLAVVILFPFGIGPAPKTLALVGPAVLWAGPLLGVLLSLERVFQTDEADGTLDLHMMSATPLEVVVAAKAMAVWVTGALPLVVSAPLFGLMLNMSAAAIVGTTLTLFVGTPALVFFGVMGAAITVRIKRSGMLLAILIIPLLVPAMIFGVSAAQGYVDPILPFRAPFLLLCAFSLFAVALGPIAGAAALRASKN
jgi:heme exporter protein B